MIQSLFSRRLQTRHDLKQLNMKQVEIRTLKIHNQVLNCIEAVKLNVPGQTFLSDSKSALICTSYFLAGSPASYIKGLSSLYKVLVKWAQWHVKMIDDADSCPPDFSFFEGLLRMLCDFIYLFFKFTVLLNFVAFCQTSTWINHRSTYIPALLNLPPISRLIPQL